MMIYYQRDFLNTSENDYTQVSRFCRPKYIFPNDQSAGNLVKTQELELGLRGSSNPLCST